jgi:ABC-type branched-subunit amino acid transport system ATPase component
MHPRTRLDPLALVRGRAAPAEREADMEARQILAFVGLAGFESVVARNLPYGAQRMLEIARALASRPRLLLLDEPAAGLNAAETEELIQLLRRIRGAGLTLLLIEHDMNLVMAISDVVSVLNFGKKIGEGPPREVERNDQVIEAYLGRDEEPTEMEAAHA